jgi:hypothetical protein
MTVRAATCDRGAGITAPRSRAWAIGSGADASPTLPGETDEGTPMTNLSCVLYNDPVIGYPPT